MGFTVADGIQPRQMSAFEYWENPSPPDGISDQMVFSWHASPTFDYLGVWLDTTLSWREHIQRVSQRALAHVYASSIVALGPFGDFTLLSFVDLWRLWCSLLSSMPPLYGVQLCVISGDWPPLIESSVTSAIASFGFLRTVSHSASQMMAGFLPAEFLASLACRGVLPSVVDLRQGLDDCRRSSSLEPRGEPQRHCSS